MLERNYGLVYGMSFPFSLQTSLHRVPIKSLMTKSFCACCYVPHNILWHDNNGISFLFSVF